MTLPTPPQDHIEAIVAAERAQELLTEGRLELGELDARVIAAIAHYFDNRKRVVEEKITPAKKVLGQQAFVPGQHQAVLAAARRSGEELGIPQKLVDALIGAALSMSVAMQEVALKIQ